MGTKPNFMFRGLKFSDGVLTVLVGSAAEDHAEISFEHVRTFAFLKESDFFREFERYEHLQLFWGGERTLGVFRLNQGAILQRVLGDRLDSEKPRFFWVSSPDECFEVVGFSDPQVRLLTAVAG